MRVSILENVMDGPFGRPRVGTGADGAKPPARAALRLTELALEVGLEGVPLRGIERIQRVAGRQLVE